MKTLPSLAILAAIVALLLIPAPAVTGSVLFSVGLLAIFGADYMRVIKPRSAKGSMVMFPRPDSPQRPCELAA